MSDLNDYFIKKYKQFPVVQQKDLPGYQPLQSENVMLATAKESIHYSCLQTLGFRKSLLSRMAEAGMIKIRKTTAREKQNSQNDTHFTFLVADDCIGRNAVFVSPSGQVYRESLLYSDKQALFVFKCDDADIKNVLIFNDCIELLAYIQIAELVGHWPWQTIGIASVDHAYQQRCFDNNERNPFQAERLMALIKSLSLVNRLSIGLHLNSRHEYILIEQMIQEFNVNTLSARLRPSALVETIDGLSRTDKVIICNAHSYYEIMYYLVRKIEQRERLNKKHEEAEFRSLFADGEFSGCVG